MAIVRQTFYGVIEMCRSTYRPIYQPRYRPSDCRHIDRLSADISVDIAADTRPIRWPLIVGRISVNCRWYIGELSYNKSLKFRLSVIRISSFFGRPRKFLKASRSDHVRKFSRYQARHSSEILPNTQNTKKGGKKKTKEDKDAEG